MHLVETELVVVAQPGAGKPFIPVNILFLRIKERFRAGIIPGNDPGQRFFRIAVHVEPRFSHMGHADMGNSLFCSCGSFPYEGCRLFPQPDGIVETMTSRSG